MVSISSYSVSCDCGNIKIKLPIDESIDVSCSHCDATIVIVKDCTSNNFLGNSI
jgi:hypothetical protein